MLISFAVTAKLICVLVFAYAKIRFSHVVAHIVTLLPHMPSAHQGHFKKILPKCTRSFLLFAKESSWSKGKAECFKLAFLLNEHHPLLGNNFATLKIETCFILALGFFVPSVPLICFIKYFGGNFEKSTRLKG